MNKAKVVQDRRQDILDSAEKVFAVRGFAAARVDDIAETAGVGKGTIYLYFPSKQELFISLLENRVGRFISNLEKWLADVDSLEELLQVLVLIRGQFILKHRWLLEALSQSLSQFPLDLQKRIWELRQGARRVTIRCLKRLMPQDHPVPPERAVDMVEGAIDYVVASLALSRKSVILTDVARDVMHILLPGLIHNEYCSSDEKSSGRGEVHCS